MRLAGFLICAFLACTNCRPQRHAATSPGSHGTINILLANGRGIVLITDSRATYSDGQHRDDSPKLFELDNHTVCSIAGFATDPGPFPEMRLEIAGAIRSFREGLAHNYAPLSFRDKAGALAEFLRARLDLLVYGYQTAGVFRSMTDFGLQVLIAGYDLDGSADEASVEIGASRISSDSRDGLVAMEVKNISVSEVDDRFSFRTAGIDDSVQSRLKAPGAFLDEPAISSLYSALKRDEGATMSIDDLANLAKYLEKDAAQNPHIGGPIQIAELQKGDVVMRTPNKLFVGAAPKPLILVVQSSSIGPGFLYHSPGLTYAMTAYINDSCMNSRIRLDGAIIYSGEFDGCIFFYNGGLFERGARAVITSGLLVLGPKAQEGSVAASEAMRKLPELKPVSYNELPLSENLKRLLWGPPPDGR